MLKQLVLITFHVLRTLEWFGLRTEPLFKHLPLKLCQQAEWPFINRFESYGRYYGQGSSVGRAAHDNAKVEGSIPIPVPKYFRCVMQQEHIATAYIKYNINNLTAIRDFNKRSLPWGGLFLPSMFSHDPGPKYIELCLFKFPEGNVRFRCYNTTEINPNLPIINYKDFTAITLLPTQEAAVEYLLTFMHKHDQD